MTKIKKNLNLLLFVAIFFSYSVYLSSSAAYSTKEIWNSFQEVLPADESFKFSAFQIEDRIILSWELKENCFLYKDKFKTYSDNDLVENQKVEGEAIRINDIYFGNVDVFYNGVRQTIDNTEDIGFVKVVYQGCNEKGFCYPPISKEIQVDNLENF